MFFRLRAPFQIPFCVAGLALAFFYLAHEGISGDKGAASFPRFRMQEIEKSGFTVGYAVTLVDVNGDGKKDIVVVDSRRVVWYENPGWKMRTMIQGQTAPDNVCIAPHDIDGDGQVDFALGASWNPGDTRGGGTLQWLKRGKSIDEPWTLFPIDSEPTVHRIRWADIYGDGKPRLLVVPLFGRNSSPKNNWMDAPLRVLAYQVPKNPQRDRWLPETIDHNLHVAHNFWPIPSRSGKGQDVLVASYEGVTLLQRNGERWTGRLLGTGNQENPKGKRGASEIKQGQLKNGRRFIATIEPWHGYQVVVYTEPGAGASKTLQPSPSLAGASKTQPRPPFPLWDRHVIDDQLRWGHAVWCADLDGDGNDELIIGVRDDPGPKEKVKDRRGVRIYKALDDKGTGWARYILENGGVAVEDLAAADLDGDGLVDIVAVGRQTHNARIYWNLGSKK